MRLTLAAVLLFAAGPALAQDPKPNTLTQKEAADGWLLLFDGETPFGLDTKGDVRVADRKLVIGGEKGGSVTTRAAFGSGVVRLPTI